MEKHLNVLVLGSELYGKPIEPFCNIITGWGNDIPLGDLKYMDCVLFTGGEDVSPDFYNGANCGKSYTNRIRDIHEQKIFSYCREHSIKMTGICRGSQFLNVMAGGRMYQDIKGHLGNHPAYFSFLDEIIEVSSTHHQLVELPKEALPLVWSIPKRSTGYYFNADGEVEEEVDKEIESAIYPHINAVAVQFHPEFMPETSRCNIVYARMIYDFIENDMEDFVSKYYHKEISYVGG